MIGRIIAIFVTMESILKSNLSQIRKLMQMHGVVSAYVFGSAATGTMNDDSDVDFMVRFSSRLGL